jgi:hypothetical protein
MKNQLLLSPDAAAGVAPMDLNHLTRENIINRLKIAQRAIEDARRISANVTEIKEFIEEHAEAIQKKIVAGITRDQAIHSIRVQIEHDASEDLFSITREELIQRTAAVEKKAAKAISAKPTAN